MATTGAQLARHTAAPRAPFSSRRGVRQALVGRGPASGNPPADGGPALITTQSRRQAPRKRAPGMLSVYFSASFFKGLCWLKAKSPLDYLAKRVHFPLGPQSCNLTYFKPPSPAPRIEGPAQEETETPGSASGSSQMKEQGGYWSEQGRQKEGSWFGTEILTLLRSLRKLPLRPTLPKINVRPTGSLS